MKTILALALTLSLSAATSAHADLALRVGTFDLYGQPGHVPSPSCDVGHRILLDEGRLSGPFAVVTAFVRGTCEVAVDETPLYFPLTVGNAGCGSTLLTGSSESREGSYSIRVIDHRTRLCRDLPPAKVIVELTGPSGTTTLYSRLRGSSD